MMMTMNVRHADQGTENLRYQSLNTVEPRLHVIDTINCAILLYPQFFIHAIQICRARHRPILVALFMNGKFESGETETRGEWCST